MVMEQAQSVSDESTRFAGHNRTIYFFGECSDNILQYLMPLQGDVIWAIDHLYANRSDSFSKAQAQWLRLEWNHLFESAIQERAAQHPNSTAMPFDPWIYPKARIELHDSFTSRAMPSLLHDGRLKSHISTAALQKVPGKNFCNNETLRLTSPSRTMLVSIPRAQVSKKHKISTVEASFGCNTTRNGRPYVVYARFIREFIPAAEPRLYTQLNVFIQVNVADLQHTYDGVLEYGSLADVNRALRAGTISPYHVDEWGDNFFLYVYWISVYIP